MVTIQSIRRGLGLRWERIVIFSTTCFSKYFVSFPYLSKSVFTVRRREIESENESDFTNKQKMDGQDSEDPKQSSTDMTIFVQNLLQQMQARFQTMSESIVSKIDEMGGRINELEQSISELKTEMGAEGSPSPLPPPSKSADDVKPDEGSA